MWVNPGATQGQYANIIDNNHAFGINWTVQQDSSTTNRYIFGGGGPAGDVSFNLTANTWQHLTLTRDAGGVKKVYIDGVLIDTKTDTPLNYNGNSFFAWAAGAAADATGPAEWTR